MTVKKIIGKIHLWLGLASGLLVFIIAITGCIYAFQEEIQNLTQPYRFVEPQNRAMLPPSAIRKIADAQLPGKHIHAVLYQGKERAANAIYYSYEDNYYDFVYVNQYTGDVLKVKDVYQDFFRIVLDGHFYLWLPHEIGQPVVATATLIFVMMLVSGLFLWWPRNRNGARQRLTVKWNARWRRKNYDLHSVLGFYITWIALLLALTGLVWGFTWFRDAVYIAAGGDKSLEYVEPLSDTPVLNGHGQAQAVDLLWESMKKEFPKAGSIEMHFPVDEKASILAAVNPDAATYWKIDYIYFDQYTLEEVPVNHVWNRFENASVADKLMRMNYDIHTGAIAGLPGKALAFLASLLVASLPVTGFLIWWGKRKKSSGKNGMSSHSEGASVRQKIHVRMPKKVNKVTMDALAEYRKK